MRRRVVWAQTNSNQSAAANNTWTTQDLLSNYRATSGATTAGCTVLRTHLWVLPHAPTAGDTWWVGLSVLDQQDLVAFGNNAQVPNPSAHPYVDWAYSSKFEFDVNLRTPGTNSSFAGLVLDLKSKRKVHNLDQTWSLTIMQDTVTTVAKQYDFFARVLLALP